MSRPNTGPYAEPSEEQKRSRTEHGQRLFRERMLAHQARTSIGNPAFVPDWAKDAELLPKRPPVRR